MLTLRDYQQQAVDSAWEFLREQDGHPVLCLPTGSGKSLVIAELARHAVEEWEGRVLVVTHVHELIQQNADKFRILAPGLKVGIHSASAGSRDTESDVVFVQIQSAHRHPELFGRRDLVLVDECHLISNNQGTMYQRFLDGVTQVTSHARVIGLTATPFRLDGPIIGPGCLFQDIAFDADLTTLVERGFLSPLVTTTPGRKLSADLSSVGKSGGEYVLAQLGRAMTSGDLVSRTVEDILDRTADRKSVIVFASTVQHGQQVLDEFRRRGAVASFVSGETPGLERGWTVDEFKRGAVRFLVNVNCLSTGFDHPGTDCVVSLRPTESVGLWLQQIGRGLRTAPGKTDCLVLDYSGNLQKFGPINLIKPKRKKASGKSSDFNPELEAPKKTCTECGESCHAGFTECPVCHAQFPERQTPGHSDTPDQSSSVIENLVETFPVGDVSYTLHLGKPKGDGKPRVPVLRVGYYKPQAENSFGLHSSRRWPVVSEWVCLEHTGFARSKAEQWWRKRSHDPVPDTVADAVVLAEAGALAAPLEITIRRKTADDWPEVVRVKLGPKPAVEHDTAETVSGVLEDLPF